MAAGRYVTIKMRVVPSVDDASVERLVGDWLSDVCDTPIETDEAYFTITDYDVQEEKI